MSNEFDASLAAALAWAARGFKVHPVAANRKEPILKNWPARASADEAVIRAMWQEAGPGRHNIGCALGGGFLVADFDDKPGKRGFETQVELDLLDPTLRVRTPNGAHAYYSGDDCRNAVDLAGPGSGLDVRGIGGFVLAPGSIVDGKLYTLENDAPIIEAPPQLRALLSAPRARLEPDAAPVVELDAPASIAAAAAYLETAAPAIQGKGGDERTFDVAAHLKDLGVSKARAVELMAGPWNERCAPPWQLDELAEKVANGFKYARENAPGSRSPIADFSGVKAPAADAFATAEPARERRRFFRHGDDWRTSVDWLYFDLLPATGLTLLVGPSQAGKSFVVIKLAVSLATGEPFFGVTPDAIGGTIYIGAEAEKTVRPRLHAAAEGKGPLPISVCEAGGLADEAARKALAEDVASEFATMHERFGAPCRNIVFDTLSASGLTAKGENDNAVMEFAVAVGRTWARELRVNVTFIHHPPKSGEGERGGGALRAGADTILTIEHAKPEEPVREFKLTKSRETELRTLGSFTLATVELGEDERGRPIRTAIVHEGAAGATRRAKTSRSQELVLECLATELTTEAEQINGATMVRRSNVRSSFNERYPGKDDPSNKRRLFNNAVDQLRACGLIRTAHFCGVDYVGQGDAPKPVQGVG